MRAKDVIGRLDDHPFRPFRIHLSDRSSLLVLERWTLLVGASSVVLASEFGNAKGERVATRWRTIALFHMHQFSDLDEPVSGKRQKRK